MNTVLIGVYHGDITIKEHKIYIDAWLTQDNIDYRLYGDPKPYYVKGLMQWNGTGIAQYNIARDFALDNEFIDTEIGKIVVTSWCNHLRNLEGEFEFTGIGEALNFIKPEERDLNAFKRFGMCRLQDLD